jgi:hypothetical protein
VKLTPPLEKPFVPTDTRPVQLNFMTVAFPDRATSEYAKYGVPLYTESEGKLIIPSEKPFAPTASRPVQLNFWTVALPQYATS